MGLRWPSCTLLRSPELLALARVECSEQGWRLPSAEEPVHTGKSRVRLSGSESKLHLTSRPCCLTRVGAQPSSSQTRRGSHLVWSSLHPEPTLPGRSMSSMPSSPYSIFLSSSAWCPTRNTGGRGLELLFHGTPDLKKYLVGWAIKVLPYCGPMILSLEGFWEPHAVS